MPENADPSVTKITAKDLAFAGPDTIAGKYLRSFWQPVCEATALPRKRAIPCQIMGENWTLYRGHSGNVHMVSDRCAHRHAKLSVGWVEGDEIRCFYHGWKYDGGGKCVEQPAEANPFCHRIGIRTAPVREYIGLIFAYLGESTPPELPRYPEFEAARTLTLSTRHAFNFFNSIDNLLDASHLGFVHRDHAGGFDGRIDSPVIEAKETCWGASSHHRRPSGNFGLTQFGMPNIFRGRFFPRAAGQEPRDILIWYVPVNDESTLKFYVEPNRMPDAEFAVYVAERNVIREKQCIPACKLAEAVVSGSLDRREVDQQSTDYPVFVDDVAMLSQGRIHDRSKEHLGASDAGLLMVRNLWMRELRSLQVGRRLTSWRYDSALLPLDMAAAES